MEVPVINRISSFDGGVATCLQSPSFLSQILSFSGKEGIFQPHSFWKWSAIIIAMIASVGTIISRIRILVVRLQCYYRNSSASQPLLRNSDDDLDYSDDEDDAVSWSSSSSVSDFEDDEGIPTSSFSDDQEVRDDKDFLVKGSGYNLGLSRRRSSGDHRRFSWSDFSTGKSVVKLWGGFGLGFDLEDEDDDEDGVVSFYDDKNLRVSATATAAAATSYPATVLTAGTSESGNLSLGVWDGRVGCRIPAILAEWGPQLGRIVGVASDNVGKVYVRDDVNGGVTVGDLRNFSSPLKSLMAAYGVKLGRDSAL